MISNNLMWWGYIHTNGSAQVKRYFSKQDLDEAHESPFVDKVIPPFEASNREEALTYMSKTK